jgi:hypothetical protein
MVKLEVRAINCFGKTVRDNGHKRVPEPPAIITGMIIIKPSNIDRYIMTDEKKESSIFKNI